jgi:protein phosphatase 1L
MTQITMEQTPNREDEYERIHKNNGLVVMKGGVARVDGTIAVSRAIGDMQYKEFLIPEPEIESHQISQDDDLLILSTDGLFLVDSKEIVAQKIHELRQSG